MNPLLAFLLSMALVFFSRGGFSALGEAVTPAKGQAQEQRLSTTSLMRSGGPEIGLR